MIQHYLIPNMRPILFLLPVFVVGIPVNLAIFLFAAVMPNAFFQLNESPGIIEVLRLFAMIPTPYQYNLAPK